MRDLPTSGSVIGVDRTDGRGCRFNDAALMVTVKRDQTLIGDAALTNVTFYDQLGRTALSQQMESPSDTNGIKAQTRYMYSGNNSYKLVSNPYRAPASGAASSEQTMGWTATTYDQNGRPISIGSFNGSGAPAPRGSNAASSGTVTISYNGPSTTVTDQAGSQRTSSVDALGRLNLVLEYPGSGSYSTSYSYDALDDLSGVSQSGQTRTFAYDSMKRLIASKNPENWTSGAPAALLCAGGTYATCYVYDADGNLASKLDNRGSLVSYQYDPLNRLTLKLYNNQAAVTYTLTGDTSSNSYSAYDALGRVTASSQSTFRMKYYFTYGYNLTDALVSETYPSGRIVNNCYDGANRVNQVGGNCAASSQASYIKGGQYAAHGEFSQYQYGNGLQRTVGFNGRLQPLTLADQLSTQTLFNASLNWGTTNNNGNLQSAAYPTGGFTDTFTYDGVNRLYTASDSGGWSRTFSYDAFGNMMATGNPSVTALAFNSNNQIVGKSYDQAGNQLSVNGNTVAYDFENHVVSETDGISQAVETYVYDGDGRRVEKYGPGGTPRTVFVYDALGRVAAEYNSTVLPTSPCLTCYLSDDHLGTARLITDSNGKVAARHDYLPFGEEVAANTFGRNGTYGSGADAINQRFTGKERDSESGLDYFGARYYGSALGRFTSPDWSAKPEPVPYANLNDPQTLNLYGYVRNNPLAHSDPDGHCTVDGEQHFGWCIWHTLGFYETQVDRVNDARNFFTNNQVTMKGQTVDPTKLSDKDVLQAFSTFNQQVRDLANMGANPYAVMATAPTVFRGGSSLQARPGVDVKVDSSGMVQPGRGLSVNADPAGLEKFGGARQVESIPPELEIVQRGQNANHYEIAPRQPMTLQRFQELLNEVKLK